MKEFDKYTDIILKAMLIFCSKLKKLKIKKIFIFICIGNCLKKLYGTGEDIFFLFPEPNKI